MSPGGRPRLDPAATRTRDKMTPSERGLKHINVPVDLRAALKAGAHARGMTLVEYLTWLHERQGASP